MNDYSHLDLEPLGCLRPRQDRDGTRHAPDLLDGRDYCNADLLRIGGDGETRGLPNRLSVAAFTGDPSYLALHGNRDPHDALALMRQASVSIDI